MNLSSGRSRWRTDKAVYLAYAQKIESTSRIGSRLWIIHSPDITKKTRPLNRRLRSHQRGNEKE
jgi:hypothetical protein